jgi:CheY-like chemotaxis protein
VSPHSPRILIVEDEDTIGQVVVETLSDEGYEVRWARNGREALDVLRDWSPRVILLDLMMPVLDGWGFCAALHRLDGRADVPIIVLSGAREATIRAAEMGAVEALSKPFELDDLIESIARWARPDPPGARPASLPA